MKIKKGLWGADPEVGAFYEKNGERFVLPPAYFREFLGVPFMENLESKRHPIFIKEDNFMAHEDGVAFELTVPPSDDWEEMFERIQAGYKAIEEQVLAFFPEECVSSLAVLPTLGYEVPRWTQMSDEFQANNIFGCDSDKDTFDPEADKNVIDVRTHPFRYFGGHVHRSGIEAFAEDPIQSVKCLATTAGVAAIAYSDVADLERLRTFRYGKPGKFRVQNYGDTVGIEYRTISNTWTKHKEIAARVFEWFEVGVTELLENGLGLELVPKLANEVVDTILNANQPKAFEILETIKERI